jgi:hypothetical protein
VSCINLAAAATSETQDMGKRKTDTGTQGIFQTERLFRHAGQWYFATREGTNEGPFDARSDAEIRLARYITVMNTGFVSSHSQLSIVPLD